MWGFSFQSFICSLLAEASSISWMLGTWLSRLQLWHLGVILAALTLAVYAVHVRNGFVSLDDNYLIYENDAIKTMTPHTLWHIFTSYDPQLYIPLTFFSYQITYALFGLSPFAFHLGNLFLHAGNAVLLLFIGYRLSGNRFVAFCAALLFALHPLHVEAVLWASARKDVLASFFALLSMLSYMRYRDEGWKKYLILSLCLFALALLSKVSVIVLPCILLLIDWYREKIVRKTDLKETVPYILLSVLFGIIAIVGKVNVIGSSSTLKNILLASKGAFFYLRKILWPDFFSVIYPQLTPVSLASPIFLLAVLGIVALVCIAAWSVVTKKYRALGFAITWYFLFLAPSSPNFSKNGFLFFASDRYAYLASFGIFFLLAMCFVWALNRLRSSGSRQLIGAAVLGAIAIIVSERTIVQGYAWKDSIALYQNVLRYYPDSAMAHANLGMELYAKKNVIDAEAHMQTAIELSLEQSIPYINLAAIRGEQGKIEEALSLYRKMTEHFTFSELTSENELKRFYWVANRLVELNAPMDAVTLLEKVSRLAPWSAEAAFQYGALLSRQRRFAEARAPLEAADHMRSNHLQTLYRLAEVYSELNDLAALKNVLTRALQLDPQNAQVKNMLQHL